MVSILFALMPILGLAQGQIGEAKAIETVRNFYNGLNSYAQYAYEHQGKEHYYSVTKDQIISYFNSREIVVMDINHLRNGNDLEDGTIEQYLRILNQIAKDRLVKFELVNMPKMINREIGGVQVTVKVLSTENSYQNTFGVTFTEGKISNICCIDEFKKIDNINKNPEESNPKKKKPAYPLEPELSYGAGVKLGSNIGVSAGLSIGGLSENWFVSRLKFGVEYFKPHGMKEYIHYPTSSNGQPSTMTYETIKDGDFGLGINMGYTFIPGKHHLSNHHLTAFLGIGGSFYDFWYEKTGASKSDYVSHHSSALYFKPSLRYDFKIIGVEAGYYFCPNYSPMQGMSIQLIINL